MRRAAALLAVLACAACMKAAPFTVEDRLAQFQEPVRQRLAPDFEKAPASWPPPRLALLAFKEERLLEAWAPGPSGAWTRIKTYPILAASGGPGPKLREGDRQVPEGLYTVEWLNPNSRFHLSLKLDYPNAIDRARAREEGRTRPGSDIMIHGHAVSIGCLAMGDPAAEELFVMAALAGPAHVRVIIAPVDLRRRPLPDIRGLPLWTGGLYLTLREALQTFPVPEGSTEHKGDAD
jgi:murein L,D-transpeptidase YafK